MLFRVIGTIKVSRDGFRGVVVVFLSKVHVLGNDRPVSPLFTKSASYAVDDIG